MKALIFQLVALIALLCLANVLSFSEPTTTIQAATAIRVIYVTNVLNVTNWVYPKATNYVTLTLPISIDTMSVSTLHVLTNK